MVSAECLNASLAMFKLSLCNNSSSFTVFIAMSSNVSFASLSFT